jgi:monoamine oxidase
VREFGLTLEPFHGGDLADVLHLRGRNYTAGHGPEPDWPLRLSPEEHRLGRNGMAERYLAGPLQLAKGSEDSPDVCVHTFSSDFLHVRRFAEMRP